MDFTIISKNFLGRPEEFEGMNEEEIIGGGEVNVYRTAQLLLEDGHDVTVVQEDNGVAISEYDGIQIRYVSTPSTQSLRKNLSFNYRWRSHVPDGSYVHLQNQAYAVPFYKGIHSFNQPGLTWDYPGRQKLRSRVEKYFTRKLLENGAYARASDNSFLSYVQSEYANQRNRVIPIPNAVDTERFAPADVEPGELGIETSGRKLLLFPRTLNIRRGALLFLDALRRVKRQTADFYALFIGAQKKGIMERFRRKVTEYDLAPHVEVGGHVPRDEIDQYYNAADLVTIPTYHSEGTSIACIEAMACGKPLVVTDVGGLKELIYQDETDGGYKVKPDPEKIAKACLKILENDALQSELEANSRDRALRYYEFDRWEADLRDFFRTVVDESPIPTWGS